MKNEEIYVPYISRKINLLYFWKCWCHVLSESVA